MYEGKLKTLEEDVEKKNKMLSDVKILLREAAEREQSLLRDNEELQQKVHVSIYSKDCLLRTKNTRWFVSEIRVNLNIASQWSASLSTEIVQIRQTLRIISSQINRSLLYIRL